jgi:hypothetical protein
MEIGGRRTGAWAPGGSARPVRRGAAAAGLGHQGMTQRQGHGALVAGDRRGRLQQLGHKQQEPGATAMVMQGSRDWPCEQEVMRRQREAQAKKMRPRVTRAGFIGHAGGWIWQPGRREGLRGGCAAFM